MITNLNIALKTVKYQGEWRTNITKRNQKEIEQPKKGIHNLPVMLHSISYRRTEKL